MEPETVRSSETISYHNTTRRHNQEYHDFNLSRRENLISWNYRINKTALGPTQPSIQVVPGALSLVVKQPGREADHSPPPSVEVTWAVT